MALNIALAPFNFNYTRNPVVISVTTDNYSDPYAYCRIIIQVNVADFGSSPDWQLVAQTDRRVTPGTTHYAFDLSRILNDHINTYDYQSRLNFSQAKIFTKTIRHYRLTVTEYFDNRFDSETHSSNPEFYAIKGGIDKYIWGKSDDFITGHAANSKMPLTWLPSRMRIGRQQPFFLGCLNADAEDKTNLVIKASINYLNGSNVLQTADLDITDPFQSFLHLQQKQIVMYPAGIPNLDLETLVGSAKIISYSVYLDSDQGQVTTPFEFLVDRNYYPVQRYFMYRNSLGLIDLIRCTGKADQKIDITTGLATRNRDLIIDNNTPSFDYNSEQAERFEFELLRNETIRVFSGKKTRREVQCFQDFLSSDMKFEYIPSHGLVPIILDNKSFALSKDNDPIPSFTFSYKYADENYTFTPRGIIPITQ